MFHQQGYLQILKIHYPVGPGVTPPKFNSSPLKNGGWKTILSYWEGNFSGAMLNFGCYIRGDFFGEKKNVNFGDAALRRRDVSRGFLTKGALRKKGQSAKHRKEIRRRKKP